MSNIGKMKITVRYNIGSKPHEKEFKTYALLGKWMTKNWMKIHVVRVSVKNAY